MKRLYSIRAMAIIFIRPVVRRLNSAIACYIERPGDTNISLITFSSSRCIFVIFSVIRKLAVRTDWIKTEWEKMELTESNSDWFKTIESKQPNLSKSESINLKLTIESHLNQNWLEPEPRFAYCLHGLSTPLQHRGHSRTIYHCRARALGH